MSTHQDTKPKIMTAQEVSDYLRLPLTTVYEMAAKGKFRGVKCGRQWRFLEEEIISFLYGSQSGSARQSAGVTARGLQNGS